MTPKLLSDYFHFRNGFETFELDPDNDAKLLIGNEDRTKRDDVLNSLEETCYGLGGYKAVIWGDYGRGKTHEAKNIIYEAVEPTRRGLPIIPVYVKCYEFKSKEPFASLFRLLVGGLPANEISDAVRQYKLMVKNGKAKPIVEIVGSGEIAEAFDALELTNPDVVSKALRWLGGDDTLSASDRAKIGPNVGAQLSLSRDFSGVMRGLTHIFKVTMKKVIVFFVDEAQRFGLITHNDTYWSWVGCLRELMDIRQVGFVIYVGTASRDELPAVLLWNEIVTRIGEGNYRHLTNPGRDDLEQWVDEYLRTVIRKGAPPAEHAHALTSGAQSADVAPELLAKVNSDPQALRSYPFTTDAFEKLIAEAAAGGSTNRPRAVLKRIEAAAKRAMRRNKILIDSEILDEVHGEPF